MSHAAEKVCVVSVSLIIKIATSFLLAIFQMILKRLVIVV